MRMADADVLPFEFTNASDTIAKYVTELKKILKDKQDEIAEQNRSSKKGCLRRRPIRRSRIVPPSTEEVPPFLNFAPLDNAVTNFKKSSERYDKAMKALVKAGIPADDAKLASLEPDAQTRVSGRIPIPRDWRSGLGSNI